METTEQESFLITDYSIKSFNVQKHSWQHKAITTSEGTVAGIVDHLQPGASTGSNLFEPCMPAQTEVAEQG